MSDTTPTAAAGEPRVRRDMISNDVPMELLLHIFSYGLTITDLVNLASAQKRFTNLRPATESILFSSITLRQPPNQQQLYGTRLQKMLRSFARNSSVRKCVKHLYIPHFEKISPARRDRDGNMAILAAKAFCGVRDWPRALQDHFRAAQNFLGQDREVELVLLLGLMPELRSLRLGMVSFTPRTDNFDWTVSILGRILDQTTMPTVADEKLFLGNLTHVHLDLAQEMLDNDDHLFLFDLHIAPLFLRLPTMRSFKATGGRLKHLIRDWKCADRASKVTSLTLVDCDLGTDALINFIRACSALKSFLCLRSRIHQEEPPVGVVWPLIVGELESHKSTLHHLAITSYSKIDVDSVPNATGPTDLAITSLRRLDNLHYLDLDDEAIFGISAADAWRVRPSVRHDAIYLLSLLPPKLQHLVIREGRQYDPLPNRTSLWSNDCYEFGRVLLEHNTLRRLDAIGFESVDRLKEPMVRHFPDLSIKRNTWLKAYRPSGQSIRMTKRGVDGSPVMEPPWLKRGVGIWVRKEDDSESDDDDEEEEEEEEEMMEE
ncbi:hypothetical protein CLAFUW4_12634 [Fulvia fulva]|uniref:F-box domain-containing protein n=1 Tax=Passalora fulva TaxID=5499 RepID=A0A9Q8PF16_PASFU|nr:uncharacterized protein CLAFUR5_11657 [Fulvia fulva]KAK4617937.1 hypothetical protein CLAFUR4_12639 [Fulvia fulva]KAK4618899.1 hypothetical protein CLAFUR0_12650 [Fulvia fulva]UJO21244.1 hypothetical protein CLAFUR5_11657 [Fulvia fulva]WPV18009.1 hypothetical protein CLAFUW4_12634 [Fulvia fulva]WPV33152.1 hypothetical protein CLAFUW7_12641 [Fulvia fulva]